MWRIHSYCILLLLVVLLLQCSRYVHHISTNTATSSICYVVVMVRTYTRLGSLLSPVSSMNPLFFCLHFQKNLLYICLRKAGVLCLLSSVTHSQLIPQWHLRVLVIILVPSASWACVISWMNLDATNSSLLKFIWTANLCSLILLLPKVRVAPNVLNIILNIKCIYQSSLVVL